MKRLLLPMIVLTAGATLFCALRHSTIGLLQQTVDAHETLMTQIQLLAQARTQLTNAEERVRELKQNLRELKMTGGPQTTDSLLSLAGTNHLSAAQREQLLAELGFNWKSTGDYIIVSKDTLNAISMEGIHGMKLKDAAAGVLALTPDERASVDALTQSLGQRYQDWAQAHAQRVEPSGKVVAQYVLPADAEFSSSIGSQFTNGVLTALGGERGNLLLQYSSSWIHDLGMEGGDTTLTLSSYTAGDETHLGYNLKSSNGGNMSTDVTPYQPFPEAFLPVFPNGWKDLATRENFALPKSFQKE